jgi:hypothetical protein
MKSLLITIAILLSAPAIAQSRWEDMIAKRFYTKIDTSKKLACCDYTLLNKKIKKITLEYNVPVDIFARDSFNIRQHSANLLDSVDIRTVSNRLITKYNKQFSRRRARKFTKSCYSTQILSSIHEDLVDDLVFIQSTIYFVFTFQ